MSIPYQLPDVAINDSEITRWLRAHRLKKTQANITRATNALRAEKQMDSLPLGRDITVTAADAPGQIIYGFARVGGTITFVDFRANNQFIDLIATIACHEIDGVAKLYIDDAEVIFQSGAEGWSNHFLKPDGTTIAAFNKVFMRVANGGADQSAILDLAALNPKWTPQHRQRSWAHAYIIVAWDALLFGDGLPDFQFLVQGKKVYDPRTSTRYFSNLSALVAADYLMDSRIGLGVPSSRIDMRAVEGGVWTAANTCGETVSTISGDEVRYAINGYWQADEAHGRVLERIAASMGGHITFSNGIWKFWPAKWRAPSLTLTEDDIRGPVRMQMMASRDDIFNGVRGKHVSAAKGYIETDYPAVKNTSYATDDGSQIWENIDFHLVTSSAACQRLAKIEIERMRQGIQVQFLAGLKAFQLQVPENVSLTIERYGWSAKPFEVVKADLVTNEGSGSRSSPELLVSLSLRETASGIFDWNNGEETQGDIAPNTNLPSPASVETPMNVTLLSGTSELYIRGDGTIAPRIKVSWTALSDYFVISGGRIEIQYKRDADSLWADATSVPGSSTFAWITDVQDGAVYDVRIRSVNALQYASAYATVENHLALGKTEPPSTVTGLAGALSEFGITLVWSAVTDLDVISGGFYEVREGSSWATAILIDQIRATRIDVRTRLSGAHTFLVKAVDTSGNYSSAAASVTVTITAPSISDASFEIEGTDAVLDWTGTAGSFAIQDFVIRMGDTFGSAIFLGSTRGTSFRRTVDWGGVRLFWVSGRDIAGNEGTATSIEVDILRPDKVQSLIVDVIRNNLLFKWTVPLAGGSLPVNHYLVLKGSEFATAEQIGKVSGTFAAYFELLAGDNTYWVAAVDSAGNIGLEAPISVHVNAPADFVLHTNEELNSDGATTLDNIVVEGEFLRPPATGGWVDIGGFGP